MDVVSTQAESVDSHRTAGTALSGLSHGGFLSLTSRSTAMAEDLVSCPVCETPAHYMEGWCPCCGFLIDADLRPEPEELRPDPD